MCEKSGIDEVLCPFCGYNNGDLDNIKADEDIGDSWEEECERCGQFYEATIRDVGLYIDTYSVK